jgi:uncharacterized protein YjbI with pentapeptide repeats
LWAVGTLLALVTIALLEALLVVNRDAVKWEDLLSRERIEQVALFIGIAVALTTLIVLLAIGGASLGWTGFADKTLWEWLQLLGALAIPLVLAIAGFWFTTQQEARQQRIETQRAQEAQKIENQRAEAERELAEQRAQDEALQAYLDEMSHLLLEKDLRTSDENSEVYTLAQARSATVIQTLDADGNRNVIRFLNEANLTGISGQSSISLLAGADLRGAHLESIDLRDIDLSDANLSDANLSEDYLFDANLSHAYLRDADLSSAYLSGANLSNYADLRNADLSDADLFDADLSSADLFDANLSHADLSYTDLSGADLSDADLRFANLDGANLRSAYLRDANLSSADLGQASQANLTGAEGVIKERLEQRAKSLEGTIMPDGTIYPGQYATREFEPSVSFEIGEGWQMTEPETTDRVFIQTGPKGGQLLFTNPRHVFDPSNLSEPKEVPAPENTDEWVSWFQRHPNIATSKPVPVRVGSASGKQIDVMVTSTPENYPKEICGGQPCVPLYPLSEENGIVDYEGYKDRFVIVDVGGETVLIDVGAQADRFDEFLPEAQKVLDTVEWNGG